MSIPHKTIADVTSTVPATEFVERLFDNRAVPSMQFACVDIEIVSSIINSLDIHKAVRADGLSPQFLKASPYTVRFITLTSALLVPHSLVSGSKLL